MIKSPRLVVVPHRVQTAAGLERLLLMKAIPMWKRNVLRLLVQSVRYAPRSVVWQLFAGALEPIPEVESQEQGIGLVKRLSMMRIMARRTKAATVLA